MWPFDRIAAEWPVLKPMIETAPTSVSLLVIACLAAGFGVATFLARREKNAYIAESKVKDERIEQLKEESARMANRIAELEKTPEPATFNTALYGSTSTRMALLEIEEKKTTRFIGPPSDWQAEQIKKFAAFQRLSETGAVEIKVLGHMPLVTVVTSTSTASDMTGFIRRHEKDPKD